MRTRTIAEFRSARQDRSPDGYEQAPTSAQVRSYGDLVKQTQKGSATETRNELACAAAIPAPRRPEYTSPTNTADHEKRYDQLSSRSGAALARDATDDELFGIVLDRLMRSLDEPMTMSPAERDIWLWNGYSGEVFNGAFRRHAERSEAAQTGALITLPVAWAPASSTRPG
jgi:hypothetical protein